MPVAHFRSGCKAARAGKSSSGGRKQCVVKRKVKCGTDPSPMMCWQWLYDLHSDCCCIAVQDTHLQVSCSWSMEMQAEEQLVLSSSSQAERGAQEQEDLAGLWSEVRGVVWCVYGWRFADFDSFLWGLTPFQKNKCPIWWFYVWTDHKRTA